MTNKIKNIILLVIFVLMQISSIAYASYDEGYISNLLYKSKHLELDKKKYWKILLHYNKGQSVIRDSNFFFSSNGNADPKSELQESIQYLFNKNTPLNNNHPSCKFPARFKWLIKQLNIPKKYIPQANCKNLKEYLNKISAEQIDISFASENINSLMSMMGHVFLKISNKSNDNKVEHAVGYFANYEKGESLSFIIKALIGNAPGIYLLESYDKKIDQYLNQEKRNIWEYKLKISDDQIENLILHIWEMKNVNIKYSFINHNCVTALLFLLYSIDDSLNKIDNLFSSPIDLIKYLYDLGYIEKANIIPSDSYKFRMLEGNLSKKDKRGIKSFINEDSLNIFYQSNLQERQNISYVTKIILNDHLIRGVIPEGRYNLLINKLKNNSSSNVKNDLIYKIKNPLNKSKSSSVKLSYSKRNHDNDIINFSFYPVYNSLLNNNYEYFNEFELQLMNFESSYFVNENKIRFKNLDIAKINNIISYNEFVGGLSGNLRVNVERESINLKDNSIFPNINGGIGLAKSLIINNLKIYSMLNLGYSYFKNDHLLYSNPEVGIIFQPLEYYKLNIKYQKYFLDKDYKYNNLFEVEQVYFYKNNISISGKYKHIQTNIEDNIKEVSINIYHYF